MSKQTNDKQSETEALLRFFDSRQQTGTDDAAESTAADDAAGLFSPQLSEPLTIIDDTFDDGGTAAAADPDPDRTRLSDEDLMNAPAEAADASEETTEASDDASDEVLETASDASAQQNTTAGSRRAVRILSAVLGGMAGVCIVLFGVLCAVLFYLSRPVTLDLDARVSLGAMETNPVLSYLTAAETDPGEIDTSTSGDHTLALTFFGFVPRRMQISVRDLTPPEITPYRMILPLGASLAAADCVAVCSDKTAVVHTFSEEPNLGAPGERTVTLRSQDEGGNVTETSVTLSVTEDPCAQTAEFGTSEDAVHALLCTAYPQSGEIDLSGVDFASRGTYRVTATADGTDGVRERCLLTLTLADTTPPTGRSHSFNLLSGTTLTPENFVTELTDASEVVLSYRNTPDFDSLAPQTVVVTAEDAAGNTTDFTCHLQIWDIPAEVTAECGTTLAQLEDELFAAMRAAGAELPVFDASFVPETMAAGDYKVRLRGNYSAPSFTLHLVDTTPPALVVGPITAYIGIPPTAERFVVSVEDASEVTLSLKAPVDVSAAGSSTVTVIASDASGNTTEAQTTVTVIPDTQPPAIYGVKTIYAQENGTVSYRSGVTAYDNADGGVAVKVDASGVDTTKTGKYTVIYTATDRAGNTATQSAAVYVTGANQESINLYADEILAGITNANMTDKQKAYAIYVWCVKNIRYSTATSHLMEKYLQAAYSGFSTKAGNCYTYYAVAAALLTRAGIENMEIHRDNPNAPHYWNLVKIDGAWYHLDTCPKLKDHPIDAFLLTDWQVRNYSETQAEGYYSFDASLYPATP